MSTRAVNGTDVPSGSPVSFETAVGRLEEIVRRLESADISLEESMVLFEEGVSLARRCSELLATAEKKIELLVEREDGSFSVQPLDGTTELGERR